MSDLFSFAGTIGRMEYLLVSFGINIAVFLMACLASNSALDNIVLLIIGGVGVVITTFAAIKRIRHLGWPILTFLFTFIPLLGYLFILVLCLIPGDDSNI